MEMRRNTMNAVNGDDKVTIWYKEPWPWFIVGILLVSFTWGMFQLNVAFRYADDKVVDDYYVEGKMVNLSLQRDQLAKALQLTAQLTIDYETGELLLDLDGQVSQWPEKLQLSFYPLLLKVVIVL